MQQTPPRILDTKPPAPPIPLRVLLSVPATTRMLPSGSGVHLPSSCLPCTHLPLPPPVGPPLSPVCSPEALLTFCRAVYCRQAKTFFMMVWCTVQSVPSRNVQSAGAHLLARDARECCIFAVFVCNISVLPAGRERGEGHGEVEVPRFFRAAAVTFCVVYTQPTTSTGEETIRHASHDTRRCSICAVASA